MAKLRAGGCGMSMIGTSDAGSSRLSAVIVKRETRAPSTTSR